MPLAQTPLIFLSHLCGGKFYFRFLIIFAFFLSHLCGGKLQHY
ncbi:hypothetical protein [uncultured Gammaproteobacteria bacterium]|nr:hypothetical protein [uncultured Gammaproteobacteria bacterium]